VEKDDPAMRMYFIEVVVVCKGDEVFDAFPLVVILLFVHTFA